VLSFGLRQATVTTGDDLDRFFGNEVLAVVGAENAVRAV
jgi:hypothetical protein